jgi:hypothetical protein
MTDVELRPWFLWEETRCGWLCRDADIHYLHYGGVSRGHWVLDWLTGDRWHPGYDWHAGRVEGWSLTRQGAARAIERRMVATRRHYARLWRLDDVPEIR